MIPLTKQFPADMIAAYLNLWLDTCNLRINCNFESKFPLQNFSNFLIENFTMIKIIEILIHLDLPLHLVFQHMTNNQHVRKLFHYYDKKLSQKQKKNTIPLLSFKRALKESQICYLLYCYYAYVKIQIKQLETQGLMMLWEHAILFCSKMIISKNLSTKLWLLEILHLLS